MKSTRIEIAKLLGSILIANFFIACIPQTNSSQTPKKKVNAQGQKKGAEETQRIPNTPPGGNIPPNDQQTQIPNNGVVPPTNDQRQSGCHKADPFICKVERLITEKTNKYRGRRGALTHDEKLSFVSRQWSQSQANSGNMGHSGFPRQRMTVYSQEFRVQRNMSAENVAYSGGIYGSPGSDALAESIANEFTDMWWNSYGHRVNMMGNYQYLGVGIHYSNDGTWWATQIFE